MNQAAVLQSILKPARRKSGAAKPAAKKRTRKKA
jgi:hypothetical protein